MNKDNCFLLGYIAKVHGLHGEVLAVLDVDYPEEYENLENLFVFQKSRLVPYFLEHFVLQPNSKALIKFEDLHTLEEVAPLVGTELYLPLKELPELDNDQYYYHELIGFEVHDEVHGELGKVKLIYDLQNHDLLSIDYQGKEVLIPLQDGIVRKVDKAAKKVFCQLPDGLLEIYTEE